MKLYYREVGILSQLNDVILEHLDEVILRDHEKPQISAINTRFQLRNGYIEVINSEIFEEHPFALIEIFVLMGDNPSIKGIRASTIRLILNNRDLIDESFRQDPKNIELFIKLLRTQNHMSLQLSRMARYGVLGLYLPEFERITGKCSMTYFIFIQLMLTRYKYLKICANFASLKPAIRFPLQLTFLRTYQKSNFSTLLVCTMTSQKVAAEIIASLEKLMQ